MTNDLFFPAPAFCRCLLVPASSPAVSPVYLGPNFKLRSGGNNKCGSMFCSWLLPL